MYEIKSNTIYTFRGVIGGKTQRIERVNGKLPNTITNSQITSNNKRKSSQSSQKCPEKANNKVRISGTSSSSHEAFSLMAPLKPLTQQQKTYAQEHHCFLVRNYEKVQKFREAFHMIAQSAKDEEKSVVSKGQLISKCPFGVIVSTKIPRKKFDNFCPRI